MLSHCSLQNTIMFKRPFSFKGRIGRVEYGITWLVFMAINLTMSRVGIDPGSLWAVSHIIPCYWLLFAQGAKRCHDFGKSGWWQLIPFFVFGMLLQEGDSAANEYGWPNSNRKDGQASLDEEIDSIGKKNVG